MGGTRATDFQELFRSSGLISECGGIDWQSLPAFVRVLLSTDGTVTKSLEAYFWEPVTVAVQLQGLVSANDVENDFLISDCDHLWSRNVRLVGSHSKRCFVNASSLIAFSILPERLSQALILGELGIGEIIRELGMETYRKIVAVGSSSHHPGQGRGIASVWRVYQIFYQGQILMSIREEFDLSAFHL